MNEKTYTTTVNTPDRVNTGKGEKIPYEESETKDDAEEAES